MRKLRFVVTTNRHINIEELAKKIGKEQKDIKAIVPRTIAETRPIITIKGAAAEDLFVAIEFFEGGIDEIDFIIE